MSRRLHVAAIALALVGLLAPTAAPAQEWRASARVGRVIYDGAPAGASGSSSLVLGLGRHAPRSWLGASAAVPVHEDPFWAVLGGWQRLETKGGAGLLLDLSGHGFVQRASGSPVPSPAPGPLPGPFQPPRPVEVDLSGEGAGLELLAGAFAGLAPSWRLESRAGVAAQRSRLGNAEQERALPTGDLRLTLPSAALTLSGEARAWLDDDVTHAWTGAALQYAGPVQLWGSLGGWASGGIEGLGWSAGLAAPIGPRLELQAGGRGNAFDPLYLSSTETSVWAGLSLRLGGARAAPAPVPARTSDGRAILRLPARFATATPSIAGDFNGWRAEPMRRDGSHWIWTAKLAPGVYHYAFVAADGSWFVPEGTPGRQDDGMGGHVAVVVVS